MARSYRFRLALLAALLVCSSAKAHQLSPCYRVLTYEAGMPGQEPIRYLGYFCGVVMSSQERSAVHEHMTAATIREYRQIPSDRPAGTNWKWEYMIESPWTKSGREHRSFAIIFGTWWNDDPLMLSLGQSRDFMRGGVKIWTAFQRNQDYYAGARGNCAVAAADHLARASHIGNLQHLHFMTTDQTSDPAGSMERVANTVDLVLGWLSFAYQVATGELAPDHPLTAQMEKSLGLPSIADNHCVLPENVKLRTLFARNGQSIAERNRRTPDIALGSMLHILQDSFAPAHTCRISTYVGRQRVALLRDIGNYALQDKRVHAEMDKHPEWLLAVLKSGEHRYANDPVLTGAWLIAAVDQRMPWNDVERHLRQTIFASAAVDAEVEDVQCIERRPALSRPLER